MSKLHKVDSTTITSGPSFTIHTRNSNGTPYSIYRDSEKGSELFSIGDLVSNGTPMKGIITGFDIWVNDEGVLMVFVNHTWSKVAMGLEDIYKLDKLPCAHQYNDQVVCYFASDDLLVKLSELDSVPSKIIWKTDSGIKEGIGVRGRIHAIHFYPNKIKYDLDMSFTGGANTRIYNIDSVFVFKLNNAGIGTLIH